MKEKNNAITYFLTQSLFLGFGISLLFLECGKDAYIGAILGILIGFGLISIYSYLIKLKKNKSLKDILNQNKIIGIPTRIILLLISFILLIYITVIYKLFVSSFLLTKTPVLVSITPFLILAAYSAFTGLTNVKRVANSLLPFSIVLFLISVLSLIPYFEFDYFKPILTESTINVFKAAISFASISVFPNILTIHFDNNAKVKKGYLITSIGIVITVIFINGIFGEYLANIFRFPEYMVLKQLKLLNFIEKFENVLAIPWILSLFITASMSIYSIKELVPKNKNKITTSIIITILIFLITKFFAFDYTLEVKLFYVLPYIATISIIITIILLFILIKMTNNHQRYNNNR